MESESSLPCRKIPTLVRILSEMNPVYTLISYFIKQHFNTIIICTLDLPTYLYRSRFPTKILYAFHITLWFDHLNKNLLKGRSCESIILYLQFSYNFHKLTVLKYSDYADNTWTDDVAEEMRQTSLMLWRGWICGSRPISDGSDIKCLQTNFIPCYMKRWQVK